MGWNHFFHAPVTDSRAYTITGWLRVAYAFLILCDRLLLTVDFNWLFLSNMMPYQATIKSAHLNFNISLFQLFPDNPTLYWSIHILGIIAAIGLLLGIKPKLMLLILHYNMISFHQHNNLIWDAEDVMFRTWNFLFLFLPLHHVTIFDGFGKRKQKEKEDDNWSMWPFRLWQIELCFIYTGAGLAKLANDRWQRGIAMYHVAHLEDFFGGIWAPDFLFNKLGPSMFLTWSSLLLECVCFILVWPLSTRKFIVINMLLLHLGIELAMNMHCFEWLSMLAWIFFLIPEPTKETATLLENDNNNEPVQSLEQPDGVNKDTVTKQTMIGEKSVPPKSKFGRFLLNVFLVTFLCTFFVDTVPLEEIETLLPSSCGPIMEKLARYRNRIVYAFHEPYLWPFGMYQGIWNMFCIAPNEVYQFQADITFMNDTQITWLSPDWKNTTWYEKKRWQRPMSFYDNFGESSSVNFDAFGRYLAEKYGMDNVASVNLNWHISAPPDPPADLGWFEPARQPLQKETHHLYTLNICDDLDENCEDMAARGMCSHPQHFIYMVQECRYSCDYCHETTDLKVGSRIFVMWPKDSTPYAATVRKMRKYPPSFLLEYAIYDEGEQFEWLNPVDLRMRGFRIVFDDEYDSRTSQTNYEEEEEDDEEEDDYGEDTEESEFDEDDSFTQSEMVEEDSDEEEEDEDNYGEDDEDSGFDNVDSSTQSEMVEENSEHDNDEDIYGEDEEESDFQEEVPLTKSEPVEDVVDNGDQSNQFETSDQTVDVESKEEMQEGDNIEDLSEHDTPKVPIESSTQDAVEGGGKVGDADHDSHLHQQDMSENIQRNSEPMKETRKDGEGLVNDGTVNVGNHAQGLDKVQKLSKEEL